MRYVTLGILVCFAVFVGCSGFKINSGDPNRQTSATAPASGPVEAPPIGGICTVPVGGICYAFTGTNNSPQGNSYKSNQGACQLLRGQLQHNEICQMGRRIGRCTVLPGTADEYQLHYYESRNWHAQSAQTDCANPKSSIHIQGAGAWLAG